MQGVIPVARDLRLALEPLLYTYGVDLTLHGHGRPSSNSQTEN